jgi:hypothetical protein
MSKIMIHVIYYKVSKVIRNEVLVYFDGIKKISLTTQKQYNSQFYGFCCNRREKQNPQRSLSGFAEFERFEV